MTKLHEIGTIILLQIQRGSVKATRGSQIYYDPSPLLPVHEMLLTSQGVIGLSNAGDEIIDVHHRNHPTSRSRSGVNALSFSFDRHYDEIRSYFGNHVVDGCAGENILIGSERSFSLKDLRARLAIQNSTTGQISYLEKLKASPVCVEIIQFLANGSKPLSTDEIKAGLKFLGNGRRGFYAIPDVSGDFTTVSPGDVVFSCEY